MKCLELRRCRILELTLLVLYRWVALVPSRRYLLKHIHAHKPGVCQLSGILRWVASCHRCTLNREKYIIITFFACTLYCAIFTSSSLMSAKDQGYVYLNCHPLQLCTLAFDSALLWLHCILTWLFFFWLLTFKLNIATCSTSWDSLARW